MCLVFGWLRKPSREKKLQARELSRDQSLLPFDIILQHDWPIEQCLLHIRVFFGRKRKRPCFDLFHPLADKTNNEHLLKPFFKVIQKSLEMFTHQQSSSNQFHTFLHCRSKFYSYFYRQEYLVGASVEDGGLDFFTIYYLQMARNEPKIIGEDMILQSCKQVSCL